MKGVAVLGATGSIGLSTLDVIGRHPERYKAVSLTANRDVEGMLKQCLRFRPSLVAMADSEAARQLQEKIRDAGLDIRVLSGEEGVTQAAILDEADYVMAAIVGAAGLVPTLAAVKKGKRILLANKEALVISGEIFMQAASEHGAQILPIDSEHNAVFQCMPENFHSGLDKVGVEKILLTASGGPFRTWDMERLYAVTPAEACAHPNWDMGRKISVDSATMMNKGLEVIEARWLFDATPEKIQVVVHPQSVIHSMVEYADGSILAQLGNPDMRTPIAHAMAWPERIESGVASLDLFDIAQLDFEKPDTERFPCLRLAFEVIEAGGSAPVVLNAANEVAVSAFLEERISFTRIPSLIEDALNSMPNQHLEDLAGLMAVDQEARRHIEQKIRSGVV